MSLQARTKVQQITNIIIVCLETNTEGGECQRTCGVLRQTVTEMTVMFSGGVGVLLCKEAARSLLAWELANDRIMSVRLKTMFTCATIIQDHAPTHSAFDGVKDDFYVQLNAEWVLYPAMMLRFSWETLMHNRTRHNRIPERFWQSSTGETHR